MREVLFALLPHTVLLDVAGPAEAFRIANQHEADSYTLRFVGSTRTIESGIGLQLGSIRPLPRTVAAGSIVVVTGVVGRTIDLNGTAATRLAKWLRETLRDESITL